jgi:DNA invertase Pin-like site-specific DNA recombinase
MKAYIYTRVSTTDQNLSPEWQGNVCKNYYEASLAHRGYEFGGVFHDHGESAYKIDWRDRTAGREIFNLIQPGDIIIVAKMCRAFRSARDRENCLHFLGQVGIDIAILDCAMDTTTAAGKFAAGIIALQVQWESDVKSERARAAHSVRKARHNPMKKRPPAGWKWDRAIDELVPDWDERRLMAMIYDLRDRGIQHIAGSARTLRDNGVKRDCGYGYNKAWLCRAYGQFLKNFPREGFVKSRGNTKVAVKAGRVKASLPRAERERILRSSEVSPALRPST